MIEQEEAINALHKLLCDELLRISGQRGTLRGVETAGLQVLRQLSGVDNLVLRTEEAAILAVGIAMLTGLAAEHFEQFGDDMIDAQR